MCLTSPNGVAALFERLANGTNPPLDARSLAGARVAAIGPGTARALREHGIVADVVPERFVAEALVEALEDVPIRRAPGGARTGGPRPAPRRTAREGRRGGCVALYETVAEPLTPHALAAARGADYITFTSSSTVRFFLEAAGGDAGLSPATRVVSIGPVTSATLREHGMEPHVEAERHDIDGLLEALLADAAAQTG